MTRRRTRRGLIVILCILCGAAGIAAAQSELVIVKEGSKEYHRPSCRVISDGKGVLALTRGQATARDYKPHAACDPENAPADRDKVGPTGQAVPLVVLVDGSKFYHKEKCARLGPDAKKMNLDEAAKKFWPCPTCKPPIRKRK